jgi:DNA-binding NarL/FixJ family response regulator
MIRVAILDRHPAVRAGVDALLRRQPGFATVGSAADAQGLLSLLYRADPDVLLLDDIQLVPRVKTEAPRTRVVIYASDPTSELAVAASIAGAEGLVDKAADTRVLLHAIGAVARGGRALPPVTPRMRHRAALRLDPRDRPIFAMRLAGTSPRDIAAVVGMSVASLNARVRAIAAQLGAPALLVATPSA